MYNTLGPPRRSYSLSGQGTDEGVLTISGVAKDSAYIN